MYASSEEVEVVMVCHELWCNDGVRWRRRRMRRRMRMRMKKAE